MRARTTQHLLVQLVSSRSCRRPLEIASSNRSENSSGLEPAKPRPRSARNSRRLSIHWQIKGSGESVRPIRVLIRATARRSTSSAGRRTSQRALFLPLVDSPPLLGTRRARAREKAPLTIATHLQGQILPYNWLDSDGSQGLALEGATPSSSSLWSNCSRVVSVELVGNLLQLVGTGELVCVALARSTETTKTNLWPE